MKNCLYFLCFVFFAACKAQPQTPSVELSQNHKIVFLDSLEAALAITKDEKEHFFSYITKVDMGIQMKQVFQETEPRENVVIKYKDYLKKDVLDFSKEEMDFLKKVFQEAFELCNKVSTNIFPKEIRLIKTHENHYGRGVYYTRENGIVIPKNDLVDPDAEDFLRTMLHEIAHIYTRYHPEKRKALYQLIGFRSMGNPSNLLIKNNLRNRILLNPDGVNYAYAISLKDVRGNNFFAVPIISSNEPNYTPSKKTFFSYLNFSLYQLNIRHGATVLSNEKGESTLNMSNLDDFYRQITDNTDYIIHPDEIIADNFMYVILRGKSGALTQQFSDDGIELLRNIKNVLTN